MLADPPALAGRAADLVAAALAEAVRRRGRATLALAGGSTARPLHRRLADPPWRDRISWAGVELYWGDERCVAADDAASNYGAARRDLLERLPTAPAAVEPIRGELGPRRAAREYEERLRARLGAAPILDVIVLGVGVDGHTASLFPGGTAPAARWVVDGWAPDEPHDRVSLTPRILDAARLILVLASGERKRDIVARVFAGEDLPARRLAPERLVWLLDAAAASGLPTARALGEGEGQPLGGAG